jgi:hypothetical protein
MADKAQHTARRVLLGNNAYCPGEFLLLLLIAAAGNCVLVL